MDIGKLQQLIDGVIVEWAESQPVFRGTVTITDPEMMAKMRAEYGISDEATVEVVAPEEPKRELPKDKRVVRTKGSGDRVYLLDEIEKTRQWVTTAELLDRLGFSLNDVTEVDDNVMMGYKMAAAIFKVDEPA